MQHPWSSALITGASSGIGEAFATSLGRSGVDLVLVARRAERLEALSGQIGAEQAKAPQVEVMTADLTEVGGVDRVAARLADAEHPVDLLVNCAGVGAAGPFVEGDPERYRRMIELNVTSLMALCHAAVAPMVARRHGWVVNVSSLGGHAPGPGFAVYSATKAFVTSFSESLHEELRGSGVVVTAVCPGATRTEFGESSGTEGQICRPCCGRSPTKWLQRPWPQRLPEGQCGSPGASTAPARRCRPSCHGR